MDSTRILAELREELERIDQAITVLESLDSNRFSTGARAVRGVRTAMKQKRRRHHVSASGRRRISEAAKAMWAERKKKVRSPRRMSAATRKRLSELAKQRWAKRKKKAKTA